MTEYSKALGFVVHKRRKELKITQAELAELVGVTEQTIRKIEHCNSNPQFDVLIRVIRTLHIDPAEFFYPEKASNNLAKIKLEMLLSDCSHEEIEAIMPIIQTSLEVMRSDLISAVNKNRACIL